MATLETLKPGESGSILSVGSQKGAVRRRLIDMGLTPGVRVTVIKTAPLGDPIEINLRGYDLSLRKSEAREILIGELPERERRESAQYYTSRRLDEETLRRMNLMHKHEAEHHVGGYDSTLHDTRKAKIALVGNPNSGKTTLFNALTGSEQYVGNWPGVTVDKKEGVAHSEGREITIVDLPGIYSLSPYSAEEIVARDFIIGEKPDAIINIVDSTNLERNMYLTIQLLELEKPMVMALNFMDEAGARGDNIDAEALSRELGVPVVPITARSGEGLDELLKIAHRQMHMGYTIEPDDLYDDFTHKIHHEIGEKIHDYAYAANIPAHWAAIKLIEGDSVVREALSLPEDISAEVDEIALEYENSSSLGDRETLVADSRYSYIENVTSKALVRGQPLNSRTVSDKIDSIVTHKYLALPIFLLAIFLIFTITFGPLGSLLSDGVGAFMENFLGVWALSALESVGAAEWLIALIMDGVIAGVGGVLTFLPQIALLFLFLSLLEDSGYMARAAFIMDRLLQGFGLSGKAFIPMLMGFGCTVPAVMGARTMENEKDRIMTILLVPFMSCSAKLPAYGLIASAFFGSRGGLVVFALYVLGMVMAIISGLLFKSTIFKGKMAPFIMELPPYRMPTLRGTIKHVWEKVRGFLTRAGTLIFIMSIILMMLQYFDFSFAPALTASDSMLGQIGGFIAPIFRPLGFGTWQATVALLTGLIAKEAVVASLSMFCGFSLGASPETVALALAAAFVTPNAAFAFLVFILLYPPCVASIAAIYRETNSLKWTLFSVSWQTGSAYIMAFLVFRLGILLF